MKLSTNLHRFHAAFGLEKTIDILADAGFEGIDFNMDIAQYSTDAHGPDFYREIKDYAADRGITFRQTHAHFLTGLVPPEKRMAHIGSIVKGMRNSAALGAQMIVVHPGVFYDEAGKWDRELLMDFNTEYYKKLIPHAQEHNIKVAIENLPGHLTKTPENLLELLDRLDSDVFTICYDVGHDQIAGNDPVETIRKLGSRIGCTHIHDNDGKNDLHTLPYYGVIDWEAVMKAFAESGYAGDLNYEAARFVSKVPDAFLPTGAGYMAAVGKHLIGRYRYYKDNAGQR